MQIKETIGFGKIFKPNATSARIKYFVPRHTPNRKLPFEVTAHASVQFTTVNDRFTQITMEESVQNTRGNYVNRIISITMTKDDTARLAKFLMEGK